MEISIQVKDSLLHEFGVLHVREFLQRQMQLFELQLLANNITKHLQSEQINWSAEFEQGRQDAWAEYKQKFLNTGTDE